MLVSVVDKRPQGRDEIRVLGSFLVESSDKRPQVLCGSGSGSPHGLTA